MEEDLKFDTSMRKPVDEHGNMFCPFCHSYEFVTANVRTKTEEMRCLMCGRIFDLNKAYPKGFITKHI